MSEKRPSRGDIDAKVAAIFAEWLAKGAARPGDSGHGTPSHFITWTSSDDAFRIALRRFPERFSKAEIEVRMEQMNLRLAVVKGEAGALESPGGYVFRISLGMFLLLGTGLLAVFFVKLAFDLPMFWIRCEMVALALFFALQSYAVCRILIFRRKQVRRIPWFPPLGDEPGPGNSGSEPGAGPLVPAQPTGDLPTLSAAMEIPREGGPD